MLLTREERELRASAKHAAVLAGARNRTEAFIEYAFRDEKTDAILHNQPFHLRWQQLARDHDRLVIISPVEHGKTIHLGVSKPLHLLGVNPNLRGAIVSATEAQAEKNRRAIEKHIRENPRVREVFPHLRVAQSSGNRLFVERSTIARDPSVVAIGVKGAIVGSRLDFLVLDDILSFENTRTEYRRAQLLEWVESSLFTRMVEGGVILVVGTPWHPEDLLHTLGKRPGWHIEWGSAVHNPDDAPENWRPVWPQRWPLPRLQALQRSISEHTFIRKYLCRVRADSAGRFRSAWIQAMVNAGRGLAFTAAQPLHLHSKAPLKCFTGVDLGVGLGELDALTAIVTIAIDERGRKRFVDIQSGRWTSPEIIEKLHANYLAYNSTIYVESNAAQKFLIQLAAQRFPVAAFHTGGNKHHEEWGVEAIATEIRNDGWVMPSGSTGEAVPPEGRSLISEMLHYSPDQHTGDRLMATWIASEAARLYGVPRVARLDMLAR